jgi:hypothetical protein
VGTRISDRPNIQAPLATNPPQPVCFSLASTPRLLFPSPDPQRAKCVGQSGPLDGGTPDFCYGNDTLEKLEEPLISGLDPVHPVRALDSPAVRLITLPRLLQGDDERAPIKSALGCDRSSPPTRPPHPEIRSQSPWPRLARKGRHPLSHPPGGCGPLYLGHRSGPPICRVAICRRSTSSFSLFLFRFFTFFLFSLRDITLRTRTFVRPCAAVTCCEPRRRWHS